MSNSLIYYFSATGNSLAIAKAIGNKLEHSKILPMLHYDKKDYKSEISVIGLVFPVYAFGIPLIVKRFIENLDVPKETYLFAVASNGGLPMATLKQTSKLFSKKGISLSAGFAVLMVDNATPLAGAISRKRQEKRFKNAEKKIDKICDSISNKQKNMSIVWTLLFWLSNWIYLLLVPKFPGSDNKFWIDSNCNTCKTCVNVCPVNNIYIEDNTPRWKHNCEICGACLHWCPKEAIQWGKLTKGRRRYHHPKISIDDIIKQKKVYDNNLTG